MDSRERPGHNPYGPIQEVQLAIPLTFREICIMIEVEPLIVACDFMMDVGSEPVILHGPDNALFQLATDYFVMKGWGEKWFSTNQLREMYMEIGMIKRLSTHQTKNAVSIQDFEILREKYIAAWKAKWNAVKRRKQKK
jgi:hypothetical protein